VTRMEEMRNIYKIFFGKTEGYKNHFGVTGIVECTMLKNGS